MFAQLAGYSLSTLAIIFVGACGIIALALIGLRALKFELPQWFWQAVGVVLIVAVIIIAIIVVGRIAGM